MTESINLFACKQKQSSFRKFNSLLFRRVPSLGSLGSCIGAIGFAFLLSGARAGASFKVVFVFSNTFPTLDPALTVLFLLYLGQLVQRRPVGRVVVFEVNLSANRFHKLAGWDMVAQFLVELELFPGNGVKERRDDLEETNDDERHWPVLAN